MTLPSPGPLDTRVVETHSSVLLFLGDEVYKFRKPVDLGFLDFRERAARESAVDNEVTLNRRLAPDVYLAGGRIIGEGRAFEPVVVMRRLPDDRRLSAVLDHASDDTDLHDDLNDELRRLARLLAAFHSACPTSPVTAAAGDPSRLAELWADNLADLRTFTPGLLDPHRLDHIARLSTRYLAGRGPLLRHRQAAGLVRDGHGDLLADDIFLMPDGPRVLDCLDFDPGLRYGDVLGDVAFLAMDLERLGHGWAARTFMRAYAEFSGEHHPRSLENLYVAYRAAVRAKVTYLRYSQTAANAPGRDEIARSAHRLVDLCCRRLSAADVTVLLLGGLPGTGKSTVAEGVAARDDNRDWTLLSSDVVRKELAGLSPTTSAAAPFEEGLYTPHQTRATYLELFRRAEAALVMGENVILDASFVDEYQRAAARVMAARAGARVLEVRCDAPADIINSRLLARTRTVSVSDADRAIFERMSRHADPWPTAIRLDTSDTPAYVVERVQQVIDGTGCPCDGQVTRA